MTPPREQYPFVSADPSLGVASLLPYLPMDLVLGQNSVSVMGLVDSGAMINVLPHSVGRQLGADWDQQTTAVQLAGMLANEEARVLVLNGVVGKLPPVRLMFAWCKTDATPLLLGQVNFFMEFDVSLYRTRGIFEVNPKQP